MAMMHSTATFYNFGRPPSSRVRLSIQCHHLANLDLVSKSDPQVLVSALQPGASPSTHEKTQWLEIGRTEHIKNNLNPKFSQSVAVDYYFAAEQWLRFDVYDIDDPSGGYREQDYIGYLTITLAKIVASPGQAVTLELTKTPRSNRHKSAGHITIQAEEVQDFKMEARIIMIGHHLDKKDFFGKSDPFLVISKQRPDGSWTIVHKTEVIKNTLNPAWKQFTLSLADLCSGDIECFDWDSTGSTDFIGKFQTTVEEIQRDKNSREFELINPKKREKSSYRNSGTIQVVMFELAPDFSFLDYVAGGLEISLTVAVDWTASNGNPTDRKSLHYLNPNSPNEYQRAISAIAPILLAYDTDKKVPLFGFGGKFSNGAVSHCFPLNGNNDDPEVAEMDGIMKAYSESLRKVSLHGPTNFAPVIKEAARRVTNVPPGTKYGILLILTDGEISDFVDTKRAIIDASGLPLSIVIVGVGPADFGNMNLLDSDDRALNQSGRTAVRDIVQFVPLRKFANQPLYRLSQETLAELPLQLVSYMKANGARPLPKRAMLLPQFSTFVGPAPIPMTSAPMPPAPVPTPSAPVPNPATMPAKPAPNPSMYGVPLPGMAQPQPNTSGVPSPAVGKGGAPPAMPQMNPSMYGMQQPGMMPQSSMMVQPGLMAQPGMMAQQPGMVQQPGLLQQPGMMPQSQPGMTSAGAQAQPSAGTAAGSTPANAGAMPSQPNPQVAAAGAQVQPGMMYPGMMPGMMYPGMMYPGMMMPQQQMMYPQGANTSGAAPNATSAAGAPSPANAQQQQQQQQQQQPGMMMYGGMPQQQMMYGMYPMGMQPMMMQPGMQPQQQPGQQQGQPGASATQPAMQPQQQQAGAAGAMMQPGMQQMMYPMMTQPGMMMQPMMYPGMQQGMMYPQGMMMQPGMMQPQQPGMTQQPQQPPATAPKGK